MRRQAGHVRVACAAVAALAITSGTGRAPGQCEIDKLLASAGSPGDSFGIDVDICGDVGIVGGFYSNAAYVFRFDGLAWSEEAILVAPGAVRADLFGSAVAISANAALVGASGDDENGGSASGSAYVFRFQPGSSMWVLEAKLLASDGAAGDRFGGSVAISGQTAVVGAHGDDNETSTIGGAAYVFRNEGPHWTEEAKLVVSQGAGADLFGWSVAVDGELAIIGAPGHGDNGNASGSAYLYRFDDAAWQEKAELLDSNGAPYDNFGGSVAISGETAVVGSPGDDDNGGLSGSAFVFSCDGLDWTQEAHLLTSDGGEFDSFGDSVSIDGDVIVVGAPVDTNENGTNAGSAYMFRFTGSIWVEEAKLLATDGDAYDNLADSVAVSGDMAVLGARDDDDNGGDSGSAYMFAGLSGVDCNMNGIADACDLDEGTSKDADGNGVPDECDCLWDLDADGEVGMSDFLALIEAWGSAPAGPPDFDGDGVVGILDFLLLLANWGPCSW